MKAWKTLHYNRAAAFLTALSGSAAPITAVADTAPVATPVPPPAAEPVAPLPPSDEFPNPVVTILSPKSIVDAPPPRDRFSDTSDSTPDVSTQPVETPPAPASPVATSPEIEPAEPEKPLIKITPKPSVSDRAPAEAGRFFAGIAWAGGEASFDAAAEPDVQPGISIQPAPATQTGSPPNRSNPILAATRSALVTASKAAVAPEPTAAVPTENEPSTPAPEVESKSTPSESSENAAGFFKNLNWKNN